MTIVGGLMMIFFISPSLAAYCSGVVPCQVSCTLCAYGRVQIIKYTYFSYLNYNEIVRVILTAQD